MLYLEETKKNLNYLFYIKPQEWELTMQIHISGFLQAGVALTAESEPRSPFCSLLLHKQI